MTSAGGRHLGGAQKEKLHALCVSMQSDTDTDPEDRVPLRQIFVSFVKIGAVLFGGGYAMLPLLEREVVGRRKWCRIEEMADYYAMAQLVPGVLAVNTAMLIGHSLRGFWGTVTATLGVVMAPFLVILAYAIAFDQMRDSTLLANAMSGLRPAVAGLMLGVAYTMFERSRKTRLGTVVSLGVAFLTLVCGVSAVTVILLGVVVGIGWFVLEARRRS
jgi:chromate transporter